MIIAVNEIVEGKEYYLYKVHTDKRLGYEVYASWDYIRLASHTGGGSPVVFEKDPNNPSTYYIRMTESNYSDHVYFTKNSKGWVYLDKKSEASRFEFFLDAWGRISIAHHNGGDFLLHDRGGKNWLLTDGAPPKDDFEHNRDLFQVENA
ncbi:hypothetical protein M4D68_28555 [Priestia aryabhattai]|uniref:hypothetical protein n=1 Tax=Priestia aryabhattai TaxID=412384 RepID=UPI0020411BF7|nr:hypothetical protein [Priestia aryabhattai]MCM3645049.1 hypothetical protein [Priestia aryabhattai]